MDHLPARATSCEPDPLTAGHSVMALLCTAAALLAMTVTMVLCTPSWRTRVSAAQRLLAEPPDNAAVQHCCGRTLHRPAQGQDMLCIMLAVDLLHMVLTSLLANKKDSYRGR